MNAPVIDHSASINPIAAPAMQGTSGALDACFDGIRRADGAVRYNLLHNPVILVPSSVLMNGKQLSRLLRRCYDFLQLLRIHGYRLFTDHMLSRAQGRNRQLLMKIVRNRNGYDVNLRIRKKLL